MNQAKLWIDHTISVLPDGVEDEIRIRISDLPRDRVAALLDEIVRASRTAMAAQGADLPGEVVIMVDPAAEETGEEKTVAAAEAAEVEATEAVAPTAETREPTREVVETERPGAQQHGGPGNTATASAARGVWREWTPDEDTVLRVAATPAAAFKAYQEVYPLSPRTYASVKSRWYRVRRDAGKRESDDALLPDYVLRPGARVRVRGDRKYTGKTGTVKRVRLTSHEAMVAIDGLPDRIWMPTNALVPVEMDGGDGS